LECPLSHADEYITRLLQTEGWEKVDCFKNWITTQLMFRKNRTAEEFVVFSRSHDFRENIWSFDLLLGIGWPELNSIELQFSSVSTKDFLDSELLEQSVISIDVDKSTLEALVNQSFTVTKDFLSGKLNTVLDIRSKRNKITMQNPLQTDLKKTKLLNNWTESEYLDFLNEHQNHENRLRNILGKYS
jgi:hypothetical protein